jgi:hypothetical protein
MAATAVKARPVSDFPISDLLIMFLLTLLKPALERLKIIKKSRRQQCWRRPVA